MIRKRVISLLKLFMFFLFALEHAIVASSDASEKGIPVSYQYSSKNGNILARVSYHISTDALSITIKRRTTFKKSGKVVEDYIIIRPMTEEDAQEMHTVAKESRAFLEEFEMYPTRAGESEEGARAMIRWENNDEERMLRGIFYKKNKTADPVMIGSIGYHSFQAFSKAEDSVDIFYWLGHPDKIQTAGVGSVAAHAFIDWLITRGVTQKVVIVAGKSNIASMRVAEKINMKKESSKTIHEKWPYGSGSKSRKNMVIYTLSSKEWDKIHGATYQKKRRKRA